MVRKEHGNAIQLGILNTAGGFATHLGLPRPPDPAPFRHGAGTPHLTTLGMEPGGIHGPLREGHTAKALDQGGFPGKKCRFKHQECG